MAVDSKHPLYQERLDDWTQLRDTYAGERVVKRKGFLYLPPTSGMIADGVSTAESKGYKAYDAYRKRAVFPELVSEAVKAMLGVLHQKPPKIELPDALEPMRGRATPRGESLEMLLRRINEEQLLMGRVGLMLDVMSGPGVTTPYVALYKAEAIINWDDGPRGAEQPDVTNLVVLDETEDERGGDGFEWKNVRKHRVLSLGPPPGTANVPVVDTVETAPEGSKYTVALYRGTGSDLSTETVVPSVEGRTLERIPFEFVNARDIVATPDDSPLLGLSNLTLTIYRGEADYRQALFMQGQDTLVIVGGTAETEYRVGAGATLCPPLQGDAKFIGVDSAGLPEMRSSLENDYNRAQQKSGELINETSRERESGDALRVRVFARTATLTSIAIAAAFGLQELLRTAAVWVGADPEKVIVTPNLDFVGSEMAGSELVDTMTAKGLGAPLSLRSVHLRMQQRGMTEMTWDDELAAIEEEKALELVPPPSTNEDGPEDDPAPGGE